MLDMIAERLGVRGLTLVDGCARPLADATPLERRLHLKLGPYRDYLEPRRPLRRHQGAPRRWPATGLAPATLRRRRRRAA